MTLPSSGAIGLYDVRTELGMASNVQIGLTDTNVRTLAQVASGAIKLPEDFYGKSNYPPAGTFLSSYCSGYDLYYRYANGSGGYYDTLQQSNSPSCGWPPASGTFLSSYCSGYDLYYRYANGSGGYYDTLQQSNSPSCGWPPAQTFQLSVSTDPVDEGNGVTVTVTTTGFSGDLYWRIVHNTTNNADFNNLTSGVAVVSNNTTSFAYYTNADQVTEGTENYYVEVSTSAGGPAVANTSTLSINDTSQTPAVTWSMSPANDITMQEGDVYSATVTVSDGGSYTAYYRVPSYVGVTFWNISLDSYNQFNIVNGTGTFDLGVNFDTTPGNNTKTFVVFVYDSGFILKLGRTATVTDTQEIISGPSTATVNVAFNINITNGVPNTTFTWVQAWSGQSFGPQTLDSNGNYTFNVTFVPENPRPFTYTYNFTFAATGNQRSYSVNLL
jgi:hypothetical protein